MNLERIEKAEQDDLANPKGSIGFYLFSTVFCSIFSFHLSCFVAGFRCWLTRTLRIEDEQRSENTYLLEHHEDEEKR